MNKYQVDLAKAILSMMKDCVASRSSENLTATQQRQSYDRLTELNQLIEDFGAETSHNRIFESFKELAEGVRQVAAPELSEYQ